MEKDNSTIGQVVCLRPSSTGGWAIIVSTAPNQSERRFFGHSREFLDGPPEVGTVVAFTVAEPFQAGQMPRARHISTVAIPENKPKLHTKTTS
jgi:hypothetical protein